MKRLQSRTKIMQAANRRIYERNAHHARYPARLLGPKHVQRAVFVCRQFRLVPDDVLVSAGYRPRRRA